MPLTAKDISTEERYGRLLFVRMTEQHYHSGANRLALCVCDCGNEWRGLKSDLRSGRVRSCGCLRKQSARDRHTIHGHARPGRKTAEYHSWLNMNRRCCDPSNSKYRIYGGRGIVVCASWRESFEAFLRDMGRKPSREHTIDRIDNDGNYEPGNCRWATKREQANNTRTAVRLTMDGRTMTASQWQAVTGIVASILTARHRAGWSDVAALTTPVRKGTKR